MSRFQNSGLATPNEVPWVAAWLAKPVLPKRLMAAAKVIERGAGAHVCGAQVAALEVMHGDVG